MKNNIVLGIETYMYFRYSNGSLVVYAVISQG